jgi:hypothetical protein
MRRLAWGAGVWLAFSFGASAAEPPSSLDFGASATIDVTADGHAHVVEMEKVTKLSDVPKLVPVADQVAQRLRERIESWQFVPAMRDGHAVPSRTHLYVSLSASDDDKGGMSVAIVDASTGAAIRDKHMGELVGAIMQLGAEAYVLAELHWAPDGRIVDVDIVKQLALERGRFVAFQDMPSRRAIARVLKRWTFDPEIVDGQTMEGHGTLPIWICMSSACEAMAASIRESSDNAQFATTDPVVKLRSAVAGTAL